MSTGSMEGRGAAMGQVVLDPITGAEQPTDASHPVAALSRFYRAFNERDLALMAEVWDDAPDVAMDNPVGGITRGRAAVCEVYARIFAGPARVRVEFHDYSLHVAGDVFWAVGRERGTCERGGTVLALAIRTTRLFRRVGGEWRQAHHHGSIDDPALLAAYRAALRAPA